MPGQYWGDISGQPLDPSLIMAARAEEMQEVRKHSVHVKVPIKECYDATGKPPIPTRWVHVNKGDAVNPEYRSRWVAKEIKTNKREDLFAATRQEDPLLISGNGRHRISKRQAQSRNEDRVYRCSTSVFPLISEAGCVH